MADGLIAAALDLYHDAGWTGLGASLYLSLHSGAPSTTGANELSANGYARQACTIGASSSGTKTNANSINFGPATAQWSILYYGLWTAVSGGTFLGYWTLRDSGGTVLGSAATVPIDQLARFAAGELDFVLANAA